MTETSPPYHLVIGLGTSGMSMARFLHHTGRRVVATDLDGSRTEEAALLEEMGIEAQIGFHDQETFNRADILVPSPGIPLTSKPVREAMDAGVPVTGELDIFFEHNILPVIAITGTNGKTTTTTLIGEMLKACGMNPFVGGNIGTPLVDLLTQDLKADIIVAEISSFQLDLANTFKPEIGVLLNISEDHLDRYTDFEAYEKSKWSLFERQDSNDTAIINSAMPNAELYSGQLKSGILSFSSAAGTPENCSARIGKSAIDIDFNGQMDIVSTDLSGLSGIHNQENIAAAVLACLAAGADIECIKKGLNTFSPLSHRMEKVGTVEGVTFYNDSKATNTDAVIRAVECFDTGVVLILGGRVKGTDFTQLIPALEKNVKSIVAIGESKEEIKQLLSPACRVLEAADMQEAVEISFNTAEEGEIVLLSPACASFDMYDNYVHRGNDFTDRVNRLKGL